MHLETHHWCQGWVFSPKKNLFSHFIYNWPFISQNMGLIADDCSKVRFKKQILCHVNETTALIGLHLSRISTLHMTCKCEHLWDEIFCSGSSNFYLNLYRINLDDTGQSGPIRGCMERDPVCTWRIIISCYHTCLYLSLATTAYWLDHKQTMGYLLVPWQWLGILVEYVILINHGFEWPLVVLSHTNTLTMWAY